MIGFLLSFRYRSKYYISDGPNMMTFFNGTFEFTFFRILTFVTGQLGTDEMGIDSIGSDNFVNYLIYGCFIFVMPILFFNTFTGIAINEITELFKNSEAENISTKIEYVFKLENLREKIEDKRIQTCVNFCENFLKKNNKFWSWISKKLKHLKFIKENIEKLKTKNKNSTNESLTDENYFNILFLSEIRKLNNKIENVEVKCTNLEQLEFAKKEKKEIKQKQRDLKNTHDASTIKKTSTITCK